MNEPKVLLLDEPLGALDLKLREQMQEELKQLQKQLGITFVFVTHDQGEALSMADRVAIFNEGKIVQAGSPTEIYERPRTRFTADFVGSSNVLSPEFSSTHGGPKSWCSLRPEKISVRQTGEKISAKSGSAKGLVKSVNYQGAVTRIAIMSEGTYLIAALPAAGRHYTEGENVNFVWSKDSLVAMESA